MKNTRILISGASIAGPTLAFWLQRYGFTVTIVERAPAVRPGGYAVDFRGSSLRVLERMGLVEQVRSHETRTNMITVVDRDGNTVARMPDGFTSGELEIMRGDLVAILHDATKGKVEYLFDDSIIGLLETPEGVDVQFQRAPARTFDLVIGADGLHSKTRSLVFGPEPEFLRHLGYTIAIFTAPNFLHLDQSGVYYGTLGKRVGAFSTFGNTRATVSLFFESASSERIPRDPEAQKQVLRDRFRGEGWRVPEILQFLETAPDLYMDTISQVKMNGWTKGRVALLGDAGYCSSPVSGMGTSLAFVGAHVLSHELKNAGGEYDVAFRAYEARMRQFVTEAQKMADSAEWLVPRTRWKLWLSQRLWTILPSSFWHKVMIEMPSKTASLVSID